MKPVLSTSSLPSTPPLLWTVVLLLVLDRIDAGTIVWFIAGSCCAAAWLICVYNIIHEQSVRLEQLQLAEPVFRNNGSPKQDVSPRAERR